METKSIRLLEMASESMDKNNSDDTLCTKNEHKVQMKLACGCKSYSLQWNVVVHREEGEQELPKDISNPEQNHEAHIIPSCSQLLSDRDKTICNTPHTSTRSSIENEVPMHQAEEVSRTPEVEVFRFFNSPSSGKKQKTQINKPHYMRKGYKFFTEETASVVESQSHDSSSTGEGKIMQPIVRLRKLKDVL